MPEAGKVRPTHEAPRDELTDRVKAIVLEDIRKQGPILRALMVEMERELSRGGCSMWVKDA